MYFAKNFMAFSQCTAKMERTRKRINRGISSFLLKHNCYVGKHPDFDDKLSGLFENDGVHLSFIGCDFFIHKYSTRRIGNLYDKSMLSCLPHTLRKLS